MSLVISSFSGDLFAITSGDLFDVARLEMVRTLPNKPVCDRTRSVAAQTWDKNAGAAREAAVGSTRTTFWPRKLSCAAEN